MISTSTPIDIMININIDQYLSISISFSTYLYRVLDIISNLDIDIDRGSSIEAPYIDIDSGSDYLQEDRLSILVVPYR